MFFKVFAVLLLYAFQVLSMSVVQIDDDHVNKDILVIGDTFMNGLKYNFDWNSDENISRPDNSEEDTSSEELDESFDSWSLVWYIASFGGLIAFFLVVSCSEWCCRKHIREQQSRRGLSSPSPSLSTESPPPSYELFAPPSYESLTNAAGTSEKNEFDVYVVPVHAIGSLVDENTTRQRDEDPPSYNTISEQNVQTQVYSENRENPRVSDA